jgi:hypothetical protein
MVDYIFLMHNDSPRSHDAPSDDDPWGPYIQMLKASGCFQGGSSTGSGTCLNKTRSPAEISDNLVGFIRVCASDLNHARQLVNGNPVFEAGGTVEIRELPKT